VRASLNGTALAHTPIGHVDTWTVWADTTASNRAVIDAVDWLGMDAYSYWQREQANAVDQGKRLFDSALNQTRAAAGVGAKPVWITETGWPVSGKSQNQAVPSAENAKRFWDEVGCPLFGREHVWWYTLRDASAKRGTAQPSFGIVGADLAKGSLFDISCGGGKVEEPDACDVP
jgi:glucan endo-1,3-beta-D-glucosidase